VKTFPSVKDSCHRVLISKRGLSRTFAALQDRSPRSSDTIRAEILPNPRGHCVSTVCRLGASLCACGQSQCPRRTAPTHPVPHDDRSNVAVMRAALPHTRLPHYQACFGCTRSSGIKTESVSEMAKGLPPRLRFLYSSGFERQPSRFNGLHALDR
jgi:hypothetical protein